MTSAGGKVDRNDTAPFHLKVFYRVGSYHRPDEFATADYSLSSSRSLPSQHVSLSIWPSCTLNELAHLFVAELNDQSTTSDSNVLPVPAVGARLAFRLIYPDPMASRGGSNAPARYTFKELGSVVIGGDGMGRMPERPGEADGDADLEEDMRMDTSTGETTDLGAGAANAEALGGEPDKTLADARFVIGDFVSVAILPPGRNGDITPVSAARGLPGSSLAGGPGRRYDGDERGANGWHADARTRPRRQGGGAGQFGGIGGQLPRGDWRRGERLPPVESRAYGRGRRGP